MNLSRALAVTRKQFHSLRHDPRSVALILFAPILAMVVFGFAFGTEVQHVPIVIVNHDTGAEAAAVIAHLDKTAVDITPTSLDSLGTQRVNDAQAVASITFPE